MRDARLLAPTLPAPRPWRRALRRRSSRRIVLLACLVCFAVEIITRYWVGAPRIVSLLANAGWFLGLGWLASATTFRIIVFRRQREHDERERELADRAIHISYEILAAFAILFLFANFASDPQSVSWWRQHLSLSPSAGSAEVLAFQVAFSIPLLPSAVLAWIEPDPPEDSCA